MPVVEFSDRDLKMGKIVEPAWYVMKIISVGEAPSKDGGSTNFPVEGEIIKNADTGSEDFAGVPINWNFNSKAIGFARGFLEVLGVNLESGKRYDLAAAAGETIEVYVENGQYNGRTVNRVEHKYRKVGAGK
jgi:hypothetical protein